MSFYSKWSKLKPQVFQRMVGLSVAQFDKLFALLVEYLYEHPIRSPRGKKAKFELVDQLLLCLKYLRDYPTFLVLGQNFGISESYSNKIVNRLCLVLVKILKLPSIQELEELDLKTIIIDVSEQKTERPKNSQKKATLENKNVILKKH